MQSPDFCIDLRIDPRINRPILPPAPAVPVPAQPSQPYHQDHRRHQQILRVEQPQQSDRPPARPSLLPREGVGEGQNQRIDKRSRGGRGQIIAHPQRLVEQDHPEAGHTGHRQQRPTPLKREVGEGDRQANRHELTGNADIHPGLGNQPIQRPVTNRGDRLEIVGDWIIGEQGGILEAAGPKKMLAGVVLDHILAPALAQTRQGIAHGDRHAAGKPRAPHRTPGRSHGDQTLMEPLHPPRQPSAGPPGDAHDWERSPRISVTSWANLWALSGTASDRACLAITPS